MRVFAQVITFFSQLGSQLEADFLELCLGRFLVRFEPVEVLEPARELEVLVEKETVTGWGEAYSEKVML